MKPTFRWHCSYVGTIDYMVTDATGVYRADLRRSFDDYESNISKGEDVRQECRTAIGILRRSSCINVGADRYSFTVPRETVDAFNEWRAAEHAAHVAQLRAHPERYREIADDDPLIAAPVPAKRGEYVFGEHRWQVID
jgi:hypothetical protein